MFKLSILLCIFVFTKFYANILAENDENVFKIALTKQPKFQRNAMYVDQNQQSNGVNMVYLHDGENIAYIATIKLGIPPQEFNVQIDTGSSDFWVYGPTCCGDKWKKCPSECARKNGIIAPNCPSNCQYKFFPNESKTFHPTSNYFNASYGDGGHCNGTMGKDNLQIGELKIPNINFGMANKSSEDLEEYPFFHGIMGMAFSKLSTSKPHRVESPLFEAMNQKLLKENLFTVFMRTSHNGGNLTPFGGQLTIGAIDNENCGQIIGWADLVEDLYEIGFWRIQIDSVGFENSFIDYNNFAISDTGTSLVYGPADIVSQIYKQIGVQLIIKSPKVKIPKIRCNNEYEPFIFKIAGQEYKLTKEMLTIKDNHSHSCIFGMMMNDDPFDRTWLLGDPFIRQYCHIYDMDNKRIGFAKLKK